MAAKKSKKSGKSMGKKEMQKTKGGILIGTQLPAVQKVNASVQPNSLLGKGADAFTCIPESR